MATPSRSPPPLTYSGDESGDAAGGTADLVGLLSGDAGGAGDASTRGESGESGDTVDGGNRGCGEGFVPAAKLTLPLRLRFPSRRLPNNTDVGVYITIHRVAHNKRRCISLTNGVCCKQISARRHYAVEWLLNKGVCYRLFKGAQSHTLATCASDVPCRLGVQEESVSSSPALVGNTNGIPSGLQLVLESMVGSS